MDVGHLVAELDGFIDICQDVVGGPPRRNLFAEQAVIERYPSVRLICERILPPTATVPGIEPGAMDYYELMNVALMTRGLLEKQKEIEDALGPREPAATISTAALHATVWDAAAPFWRSEHYGAGVDAAARAVNALLQQKIDRRDVSNTKLVNEAFSLDDPEDARPRLRVIPDDGSETYKSTQVGAMHFGAGCFMALRNPGAHEVEPDLDPVVATERLAAFSILARWIESASLDLTYADHVGLGGE